MGRDDVVITGGGVIGSATAYFLIANPYFDRTVAIIERDPIDEIASKLGFCSDVRQRFSNPENVETSLFRHHFVPMSATVRLQTSPGMRMAFFSCHPRQQGDPD